MLNIANDMSLGFQNNVSALNWAFHSSIHHHVFGCNRAGYLGPVRDHEGRTMKFASIFAFSSTKPSAVTLPTIFSALAITVFSFL